MNRAQRRALASGKGQARLNGEPRKQLTILL